MSPNFDPDWHPLLHGHPPPWVDEWAQDRYGVWVALHIGGVSQRFRWIPPGRFMMGSPASEKGRYDDEGPQHEVIISQGFWLGDTPVTQALWEAVMGKNPSRFKGRDRPVENVSWDDCQAFLDKINKRLPGLHLVLPSEAQWEYACRAGTQTRYYFGDDEAKLGDYAWYGDNSNGHTHPVGEKQPNAWGLYDMHGNVLGEAAKNKLPTDPPRFRPCGRDARAPRRPTAGSIIFQRFPGMVPGPLA